MDQRDARRAARLVAYKAELRAEIAERCRLLGRPAPNTDGWNAAAMIELVIDLRSLCDTLARGLMRAPIAERAEGA